MRLSGRLRKGGRKMTKDLIYKENNGIITNIGKGKRGVPMKYILMHKNTEVADIEIDDVLGRITAVNDVIHREHLPVGIVHPLRHNEVIDRGALNKWWCGRSIPASRMGIADAFEILGIYDPSELLTKCFGLSLSDHYWIKPSGNSMKWEDINFFDNEFSDDIGDVLFGTSTKSSGFDFFSPDNTSDGNLKKRWKIIDGKRCLLKSGSMPYRQQPYNEVIASIIMDKLGIDHVPYSVINIGNEPFSICEDFITKDTELVSAYRVLQIRGKENHENDYLHYINTCKEIGVDISAAVDDMIVVDYIIANEDRHFNNFGLLRNAETLEWIGAAPIFDSGTSLWFDRSEDQIKNAEIKCKPFKKHHSEQIKLVSDLSSYDFSKLDGIENDIRKVLTDQKPERVELISEALRNRIDTLQLLAAEQNVKEENSFNDEYTDEVTAEEYNINID